jgi:uncharacterized repeat protein (TIGR02543 family)
LINGDVTYAKTIAHGTACDTMTAQPNPGYEFAGWMTQEGDTYSTDNPLIINSVTSDLSLIATFKTIEPPG